MLITATSQTTEGHVYILDGNDDLTVGATTTIRSTGTDAITTWQGRHVITVAGQIISYDDGINTIGVLEAQTINILAGARITSGFESIIEESDGVIVDGIGSTLTNRGTITSHGSALSLFVHDGGTTTITNYGVMTAGKYGVWNKFGGGTLNFTNSGTIESSTFAFVGGYSVDLVTNRGTLKGNVDLGGGNDTYIGSGGRVTGQISGGTGDDRFVTSTTAERIDGGEGFDTLDFSAFGSALTVNLTTSSSNRGSLAVYDVYTNIEAINGGRAADTLTGDAAANTLSGNAGIDRLNGAAGDDVLVGGTSRDYLTGGAGADAFVFNTRSSTEMGDYILDFNATDDKIRIEGSAFGYGTYAGTLTAADFVSGSTLARADASDHFLFRTTDATLWFDADGNGLGGAVLIADLNNGVSLTAANIEII